MRSIGGALKAITKTSMIVVIRIVCLPPICQLDRPAHLARAAEVDQMVLIVCLFVPTSLSLCFYPIVIVLFRQVSNRQKYPGEFSFRPLETMEAVVAAACC